MKMLEVEFESGDGDDTKETGVWVDTVRAGFNTLAVVARGDGRVHTIALDKLNVVDKAMGVKLQEIEDKHQKLDLHVDLEG